MTTGVQPLTLYTWSTPNGRKASIALEEMNLNYAVVEMPLKEQRQKEPWFLSINPNGRVPALVDDGFAVFESGAILLYLAEKTGSFLPGDTAGRSRVVQWLMWQVGGLGPMQGQANVFNRYWHEPVPDVLRRYQDEVRRLYLVMDRRLGEAEWLAGTYSIADMACYPWVAQHDWSGVTIDGFSNLSRWNQAMGERPGVRRGMDVPTPLAVPDLESGKAIVTR